jgi:hypothetical protein
MSNYKGTVTDFKGVVRVIQKERAMALQASTASTAQATSGLTETHALAHMRGLLVAIF